VDATQVITIAVALIAASPGILAFWRQARKQKAEITQLITEAAGLMIEKLREEIKENEATILELKAQVKICTDENVKLRRTVQLWMQGIGILIQQIADAKQVPLWLPEDSGG
jgi:ATP/maltotriose-dependent transcriptional regulator MalT